MSGALQISHGLRALASHPGLTIAASLSLGMAIGAQTSVYCLIDALFLRPPAGVTAPQRLVAISALDRGAPDEDTIRIPTTSITAATTRRSPSWPATSIQESHSQIRSGRRNWTARWSQRTISPLSVRPLTLAASSSQPRIPSLEETRSSS